MRAAHALTLAIVVTAMLGCRPPATFDGAELARSARLGCGDSTIARRSLEPAERWLFGKFSDDDGFDEGIRRDQREFRAMFFPKLRSGDARGIVTDPAECSRVLASYGRRWTLNRLRVAGDTTPGLGFAILHLGPYYQLTTQLQPPSVDGGWSAVAERRTLRWNPYTHSQF